MELYELYGIIGTAIMLITEILIIYSIIKLVKFFCCEVYNSKSKTSRILQEEYKIKHFKKHFRKWLKNKKLQKGYSNFYEYYDKQYNKQFIYSEAYKDYMTYKKKQGEK